MSFICTSSLHAMLHDKIKQQENTEKYLSSLSLILENYHLRRHVSTDHGCCSLSLQRLVYYNEICGINILRKGLSLNEWKNLWPADKINDKLDLLISQNSKVSVARKISIWCAIYNTKQCDVPNYKFLFIHATQSLGSLEHQRRLGSLDHLMLADLITVLKNPFGT